MQGEKEGKDKAKEKEKEKERVAKLAALFGAKTHTIEQDEQPNIEDTKVFLLATRKIFFSCESPTPLFFFSFFCGRQHLMSWLTRLCCNFDVSW